MPTASFNRTAYPRLTIVCQVKSKFLHRQVGPITTDIGTLSDREQVYSERTSIFFKRTHIYRLIDKQRNTLIYLAISDKLIEGSPQNSISTVPIMPWR